MTENATVGDIPIYTNTNGNRIKSSGVNIEEIKKITDKNDDIINHINNLNIHVTQEEKENFISAGEQFLTHINDNEIHITEADRQTWNNKETVEGSQIKANIVQSNLNKHVNNIEIHVTTIDKQKWNNQYTKEEIDNKFSMYEFNNDWKEAVQTYDDLFIVYPDPYTGWTVNVLDTGITYRFDGIGWVGISANIIPKATPELDGLMPKEDKAKLDGIEEKANNYIHPNTPDIRHVTDTEKEYWNNKADNTLVNYNANGLMGKEDKYKLDGIEEGATNYVEPDYFEPTKIKEDEMHRFVTDAEKDYWSSKSNNNPASPNLDGLMTKEDKKKLDSIEYNANYYIHPEKHKPYIIEEDAEHKFVTNDQIAKWDSKASSSLATSEIDGLMSAVDKAKLNGIESNANYYIHPEKHKPSIIEQDSTNRFVSDADITNWNNKKDSNDIYCADGLINGDNGVEIIHPFGATNFAVNLTFTQEPIGVGDVWVEKTNEKIVVKCSGGAIGIPFDVIMVKYYR